MKKIIFLIFILGTLFCKAQDYRYSKDSVKLKWDLFTEFHSLSEDAHRINRKIVFKDTLNADSLVVTYYRSGGVYEKLFYKDGIAKTERYYPNSNIYQIYYAKDRAIIFKPYYTWTNYDEFGDTSLCTFWVDYKSSSYYVAVEYEFIELNGYEIHIHDPKTMETIAEFKSKDSLLIEDYTCTSIKGRKILKQFLKEKKFQNPKLRPRTRNAIFYKIFRIIPSKTDEIEYFTSSTKLYKRKKNQEDHTNIIYRIR
jgi:hypothetical protein